MKKTDNVLPGQPENTKIPDIFCPNCRQKKHGFIFNQVIGFFACKKCGIMFMDPIMIRELEDLIDNPSRIIKPGEELIQ